MQKRNEQDSRAVQAIQDRPVLPAMLREGRRRNSPGRPRSKAKGKDRSLIAAFAAEARIAELERQMQHHPSVAQFRIAELEAQNARLREGLDAVATMPEYDQDDAHRLRNIAKVELAETGEAK